MEKEEKITLPKTFDVCPVCQSPKRLGMDYINQLKDELAVHKDSFMDGMQLQVPLYDQMHPPSVLVGAHVKINVLLASWDVCGDCGTMYCIKFNCVETPAQVQQQQVQQPRAMPGQFPGMNRQERRHPLN